MPEYRFYNLKRNGHISGAPLALELPDDEAACAVGKKILNGHDIEIWEGTRVVKCLVADRD